MTTPPTTLTGERADLVAALDRHHGFLLQTVQGITDDQARERTTVSELTLGGLVKHVAITEGQWLRFARGGPEAMMAGVDPADWADGHVMRPDQTLEELVARLREVAVDTDEFAATADLDAAHPLPSAPWFEPGAEWTVRRVLLHLIAEVSQHAGHADIIRESLDGAKTMG
jgi:uncharacterized damage-inducible protein DinB